MQQRRETEDARRSRRPITSVKRQHAEHRARRRAERGRLSGYAAISARTPSTATPRPSAAPASDSRQPFDHELAQQPPASGARGAARTRELACGATRRAPAAGSRGWRRRSAARTRPRPAARETAVRALPTICACRRIEPQPMVLRCPACAARASASARCAIDVGQPASSVSSSACARSRASRRRPAGRSDRGNDCRDSAGSPDR